MFDATVDGIMASLAKGVKSLNALADRKDGEALGHSERAAELAQKAEAANREAQRARRVASKVSALLD